MPGIHSKRVLLIVAVVLTICSCASPTATPEESLQPGPTVELTSTASATATVFSSPTPDEDTTPDSSQVPGDSESPVVSPPVTNPGAPLASGLYVGLFVREGRSSSLEIISTEGQTVSVISVPEGAYSAEASGISPDGRYFVYYTGMPRSEEGYPEEPNPDPDITLHIASAVTGEDLESILLVKPSLYDDLQQAAEDLAANPPDELADRSVSSIYESLYYALVSGIRSCAWSPDGRYLAFAGVMEGPSSDVYIYDTEDGTVNRLTSGPDEILSITWSPDGTWIMHSSAKEVWVVTPAVYHAVRFDGERAMSFPSCGEFGKGWLSEHKYLVCFGANGVGSYNLVALDIDSGRKIPVWPGDFQSLAYDSSGSTILLSSLGLTLDTPDSGIYMIDLATGNQIRLADNDETYTHIVYWPTSSFEFVAGIEDNLVGITSEEIMEEILPGDWALIPSPDLTSLALIGLTDENGLYMLEDLSSQPVLLDNRDIYGFGWSPDSAWYMYGFDSSRDEVTVAITKPIPDSSVVLRILPDTMSVKVYQDTVWIVVP